MTNLSPKVSLGTPASPQVQFTRSTGRFKKDRAFVEVLPETAHRALLTLKGRKMIHCERYEHAKAVLLNAFQAYSG